ncbi:hypothetical protein IFM89_001296 [Coptis chinensis]|uniref:Uncharacterized protein n=1 Tax=Coptis chinensis TaxID=261450 RepID=A0A835ITH9_9MAGN|nr:hypothetical protein IFM89_001296 [Coptis chinensis]
MPTQWRTIAPIVGGLLHKVPSGMKTCRCFACVKEENYEPNDDPRKLRPGEIDPNPNLNPHVRIPLTWIRMRKKCFQFGLGWLTPGKEKRKEKPGETALKKQGGIVSAKRRELKATGIDNKSAEKRKRKGIDYNSEIPFEKKPPPGFFDVVDEERVVEQPKFPTTIEELEGKRRVDVEAQLRRQDVAKNKIAQRRDAPSSILQVNKLNDPETVRKRSKPMLPKTADLGS